MRSSYASSWSPPRSLASSVGSARKNAPCCAETTGVSSLMISEATSSRSRRPCIRPEIRARLPLSQSCSLLASVVSRRFAIMVLMLS
ncbi:hypothetical protein SALBM135S_08800 [Streptomyces alboniger]